MKKTAIICLLIISVTFLTTVPVKAQPADGLIAGTGGYLMPGTFVAVGFNAYAGETLFLTSTNLDFFSTTGFCGLSSYDALGNLLAVAYSWEDIFIEFHYDDLYVWLCDYDSGLSGNIVLAIYEAFPFFLNSGKSTPLKTEQSLHDYPEEAVNKLKDAFERINTKINRK
ncbi:MAG: hypothetical protein JSV71_06500 [Nitrospiraceae bacterium]|nr:MAG: hypothetical protein JSV71_06500 [Nitrospiraceae bacterium]